MQRCSTFPLFQSFLVCLLFVILFSRCGAPKIQPTTTPTIPSLPTTPPAHPTATFPPTRTAVPPSTTPSVSSTPEPTATLVRPVIYSGSPLSVQAEWEGSEQETAFDWSPDGSKLIFSASDGVHLIAVDTFQPVWTGPTGKSVAFSADGEHVAIATGERIEIHAAADGKLVNSLGEGPCAKAEWVGFQPRGKSLVVARVNHETATAEFSWIDIDKGACSKPFASVKGTPKIAIQSFSLNKEKDFLLAVIENKVFLWSTTSGREAAHKQGQAAVFNSDGYLFVVKDQDTITVFVLSTRALLQTFQVPNSQAIGLGGEQSILAVSSLNGPTQKLSFYDSEYKNLLTILRDLPEDTKTLSFSPDNQRLLVIAQKTNASQPSRYLVLGLYSGLVSPNPNISGTFQVTRPVTTPAPLFPILYSPVNGQSNFPTPIATPDGDAQEYRLKDWNEERGIDLIQPLVQYATANDVLGAASSRWAFMWPQNVIRLAALEFLLRFPNAPQREAVQWRLALANTILDRYDSDAWIIAQIEQGLNDGSIDPSDIRINAYLATFGFSIQNSLFPALTPESFEWFDCQGAVNPVLAPGLFGDDGTTRIVTIQSLGGGIGIVAAVHQDPKGHYLVIPIHSSLNFDAGVCQFVLVQDLTGDGRPEIWIEEYWHSGSMDSKHSYIYQWLDGQFVEVSGGKIRGFDFPYKINLTGSSGQAKTIEFTSQGPISGDGTIILKWNGERFTPQNTVSLVMFDSAGRVDPYFLVETIEKGKYTEVSQQLRSMLNDPKFTESLRPDDAAYLTFWLAISEALQFKPAAARAVLEDWLQTISTSDSLPYANTIEAFLNAYQTETDLWRACQVVKADNFPCPLPAVLRELAKRAAVQGADNLPQILESYGLRFSFTSSFDANDDAKLDWFLMSVQPPGERYDTSAFLLLSNKNGYEAFSISLFGDSPRTPVEFKAIQLPGRNDSIYLLHIGEQLEIIRIQSGFQYTSIETLLYRLSVSEYQETSGINSFDLLVWHETDSYELPEFIHWDTKAGQFWSYDYAEYLLLMENQTQEAIRLIPSLLEKLKTLPDDHYSKVTELPRVQYLMGLAYELSGDKANAANVYYDLWHTPSTGEYDHPEQPYAIMAREKLERIEP